MSRLRFLLFFIFPVVLHGQAHSLDSAVNNLLTQAILFPQEKIYLQTDKPYYISGEKIFFRVFLLDAFSHRPAAMSRYVYVELIKPGDSIVIRQQIRPENEMFSGILDLPENLPQGDYLIRAYTRFMENIGEAYFFRKTVRIADPQAIAGEVKIKSKPAGKKPDVSFYPEGGNLIAGKTGKVAFKALQSDGRAWEVKGEIVDSQDNKVTGFTSLHEGMGSFSFLPEAGKQYYAVCSHEDKSIKTALPEVKTNTYALSTVWRQNRLWITVNKPAETDNQKLYLLAHTGGLVIYSGEWDWSKDFIALDKQNFPSGVSHLLLLTEDFFPVSERLVFALHEDWLTANIQTQKETYRKREEVKMDIVFKDSLAGNFAVSITDDNDIQADTTSNILTRILLTSELRGHIPNPAYYFQKNNRQAELAADLLMMTHGWNRYDIPKALRGDYQYLTVPNEESQSFSGIVKGGLFSKPYEGSPVTIISTNANFFDKTETDKNGKYVFTNFEFPDSTAYIIQALTKKKRNIVELCLDKIIYPTPSNPYNFYSNAQPSIQLTKESIEKADLKYSYENGMRVKHLPEVTVKSNYVKKRKYESPYYREPDNSISQEEIEQSGMGDIRYLLSRISGIRLAGDKILLRGKSPLIVIDGMSAPEADDWNMINISDIAQIDVIKDVAKSLIFGPKAYSGVIVIFTKRGDNIPDKLRFNVQRITPLGYQSPVEFYSPQYDTPEARNSSIPDLRSTIYWQPDVVLDSTGKTTLNFYTADSPSTYSVIIEGITKDGELIYHKQNACIRVE
jgi:hypothetical protein